MRELVRGDGPLEVEPPAAPVRREGGAVSWKRGNHRRGRCEPPALASPPLDEPRSGALRVDDPASFEHPEAGAEGVEERVGVGGRAGPGREDREVCGGYAGGKRK